MSLLDNLAPPGIFRFGLVACSDCKVKYVSPEGTDNEYSCRKCGKSLLDENQKQYDVPEREVAEFLEKNYKGKNIGGRK